MDRIVLPGLPPLMAHPYKLIQLFSNLLLNAYQAMDGRGMVTVNAVEGEQGGIQIRLTDAGPGIPGDSILRIFDPFYTTKPEGEGTGLGLSICRMIVEEMNGDISVQSQPGGPTTFKVWFPPDEETGHDE